MERQNFSSGAKWEQLLAIAVPCRVGNIIEVGGTVAVNENNETVGIGNAYEQTKFIIAKNRKGSETSRCLT